MANASCSVLFLKDPNRTQRFRQVHATAELYVAHTMVTDEMVLLWSNWVVVTVWTVCNAGSRWQAVTRLRMTRMEWARYVCGRQGR